MGPDDIRWWTDKIGSIRIRRITIRSVQSADGSNPLGALGTSCASGMNERSWHRRGVIGKAHCRWESCRKMLPCPGNIVGGIWRRCQAMEALFSNFHIGNVGMGIMGGCRGRRFGHLVVSGTCGLWAGWWYVARHSVEVMVYQYDVHFGYGCWMTSTPPNHNPQFYIFGVLWIFQLVAMATNSILQYPKSNQLKY